MGMFGDKEGDS